MKGQLVKTLGWRVKQQGVRSERGSGTTLTGKKNQDHFSINKHLLGLLLSQESDTLDMTSLREEVETS